MRSEINSPIRELLASLRKSRLVELALPYEYYRVSSMNGGQVRLGGDRALHGPLLPPVFPEAKKSAVPLCTIGPGLEKQATDYSRSGETLHGMILDGIGSAAVDKLVSEVLRVIAIEISSRGYDISSPVNPGILDLPVTGQWNLLALANADEIGVRLTTSTVLVPRKSTSMVIGMGPQCQDGHGLTSVAAAASGKPATIE